MFFLLFAVCVALMGHGEAAEDVLLEKDYDYEGLGDSFYLKALSEGEHRLVCWENFWAYFEVEITTRWCEEYFFTFGSTYTGLEAPGELSMELECSDEAMYPHECEVTKLEPANCTYPYHVRVQCFNKMSKFQRGQPLSSVLLGLCICLLGVCVVSWLVCYRMVKNKPPKQDTMEKYVPF